MNHNYHSKCRIFIHSASKLVVNVRISEGIFKTVLFLLRLCVAALIRVAVAGSVIKLLRTWTVRAIALEDLIISRLLKSRLLLLIVVSKLVDGIGQCLLSLLHMLWSFVDLIFTKVLIMRRLLMVLIYQIGILSF